VWDGTRDITVTVTLTDEIITNVRIGHPVEGILFSGNNPFRRDADDLATSIRNSNNPDIPFSPAGNYTGRARDAWDTHENAIRTAVRNAVAAIKDGQPNRVIAGGGSNPWTADGVNLTGDETVIGSAFMRGGTTYPTPYNLPTDFSVRVVLADGRITTVEVSGDASYCTWNSSIVSTGILTVWPQQMIDENHFIGVEALTGATFTKRAMSALVRRAIEKMANEY
jgi:hypothetical protein